ncbi:serine/threonine-protein kinase [Nocardia sp. NPDC057030]|uniref:serine/threonine-protein kinase n=1 Tax=unclassified Nocardia TaxID=2637762 RepID=UPI003628C5CC
MRTLAPGTVVAGYRIERKLGTGGMGSVYLARHPRLPRRDAVKILSETHGANEAFRARFRREAEIAARLDHPNIVAVYDCGADDDRLWIAMQFVAGYDAAELIARGREAVPPQRAIDIVAGAASGLDEAHRAGLLHRDVKPANILIEPGGEGPDRILVTDFGIARAADDSASLTTAGSVLATLAYAAPEQIRGDALDHRVDVYALGCTLYQLLTGTVPFPRESPAAVMQAQLSATPPRPSAAGPAVPRALDAVVARALAKDPDERYQSCGELAQAAAAALLAKPRWRGRTKVAMATGATVVALAGFLLTRLGGAPGDPVTTTAPPPSSTPAPVAPWGTFGFIVDAFPGLLPATPSASGDRGLRCSPTDSGTAVPTDTVALVPELLCMGDNNPVTTLVVHCNADRSPFARSARRGGDDDDETWTRPSGTGQTTWGSTTKQSGTTAGRLEVRFDDPARNFCTLRLLGASSGRELHDLWWPTAPI